MNTPCVAVYPGTFDPITHGHTDLVTRAARVFDHVIVAIAESPHKTPFLCLEKRIELAASQLGDLDNIEIIGFSNLLVDFVRDKGAAVIVRGLRAVTDFENEFSMALTNRMLWGEFDTVFLMTGSEYMYLSSSVVREIAQMGGDVSQFVPACVERALMEKFSRA